MREKNDRRQFLLCQLDKIFSKQLRGVEQSFPGRNAGNRRGAVGPECVQLSAIGRDGNSRTPGGAKDAGQASPVGEQPPAGLIEFAAGQVDKNEDFAVDAHQISLPSL